MIQTWRFPIILGLSVVFGMPALGDLVLQPQRLLSAGLSYLGALAISWLGVNGIFTLVNYYADYNVQVEEKERVEGLAHDLVGRADRAPAARAKAPAGHAAGAAQPASPASSTPAADPGAPDVPRRPVARDLLAEDDAVGAAI